MDASLELHIQPNLQALLPLIPQEQLQGVHINPSPGPVTFLVKATGSLQDDFQPTWATATAALKLSSIEMKSDTVAAEGALNQLTLSPFFTVSKTTWRVSWNNGACYQGFRSSCQESPKP